MKDVAPYDRPREKLERLGVTSLGDNELLALVIGTGSRDAGTLDTANRLLAASGGVHGLLALDLGQLRGVNGIGRARAAQIAAALELGRRTLLREAAQRCRPRTPADIAAMLLPQYGGLPVEHFGIVMLDTRHRIIRTKVLTVGSLDTTIVHPREVFREATAGSASAIVLFHNHPSGDPRPTGTDLRLTTRLVAAGEIMGIDVVDHLILGGRHYFSLVEAGTMRRRRTRAEDD